MKVLYELWAHDVAEGYPGTLLWSVPLPIDQVLYTSASPSYRQQLFNCVDSLSVEEAGGGLVVVMSGLSLTGLIRLT